MVQFGVHGLLGKIAYESLPERERRLWRKWADDIPALCCMPDAYYEDKERIGKYVVLPDGHLLPHGLTDDKWRVVFECEGQSRETARYVVRHYLRRIIELMRAEEWEESVKFGGAFAHYIQDSSSPSHVLNNYLIAELMPFPEGKYYHLHKILEDGSSFNDDDFTTAVRPVLLGDGEEEAVFQIENRLQRIILQARAAIVPALLAFYKGDLKSYKKRLVEAANLSTSLLASAWHTCFALADHRRKTPGVDKLSQVSLTDLVPDAYYSQPPYFTYAPGVVADGCGNASPTLLFGGESRQPERVANSIATYGASLIAYSMPKGVFKSFSACVGLDASNAPDKKAGFRVAVEAGPDKRVEIDPNGQEIKDKSDGTWTSFSAWTNPEYIVFDTGIIKAGVVAKNISVALPEGDRLLLITYRADESKAHAVWGDARLNK